MLKFKVALDNILSIVFNPRIFFELFMCSFLEAFRVKPWDVKSDLTEMDGKYLSMCEKSVCLKASQAISGFMQSGIVSQCMLPK